jgi:putative membrane protein
MKTNASLAGLGIALLAAFSLPLLQAQDTGNQQMDNGARKMMKSADTTFAIKAAQGGITEVKLGKLAEQNASNPEIKAFGQQMVHDHGKANDDLKATAQKEGMTLPTDMNAKQQAMYDKLSKLSGPAFDRAYTQDMVKDHEEDVKEFQKEANSGSDDAIKAFAARTLPVIQGHLEKIKNIQSNLGGSSQQ